MIGLLGQLNLAGGFSKFTVLLGALFMVLLTSGGLAVDTEVTIFQDEQWQASQSIKLSAELVALIEAEDTSVQGINQRIGALESLTQQEGANVTFSRETRSDGSMVITAQGVGQGFDRLNGLFFGGKAEISSELIDEKRQVTIRQMGIAFGEVTGSDWSNMVRIGGGKIIQSNADQVPLNTTAIWENPAEISITVIEGVGTPYTSGGSAQTVTPPSGASNGAEAPPETVNVIKNGDFEKRWQPLNGIAPDWEPYDNGMANFGWYDETWPEAVRKEKGHAQLMEIHEVDGDLLDRVIAIYQTVEIVPDADYDLNLYALMRTEAAEPDRNRHEYDMHWGIDPWGEGNYDNVEEWVPMHLSEQARKGSFTPFPDDARLFYEHISGTVRTGPDTNKITLFIRGLKKFPNGTEVDFDVDDVSLVGPAPGTVLPTAQVQPAPQTSSSQSTASDTAEAPADIAEISADAPVEESSTLPASGAILSSTTAVGTFLIGGLVLILIGAAATASLLGEQKEN